MPFTSRKPFRSTCRLPTVLRSRARHASTGRWSPESNKRPHGRAILAAGFATVALAGCGGSATPDVATSHSAATASESRVNQLDQADENCANAQLMSQTVSSTCASVSSADAAIGVIECGAGLRTSGSCVFARKVQNGYAAADGAAGHPPSAFVVTTGQTTDPNPVSCAGTATRWRCESERNPAVWVAYRQP